MTMSDGGMDDLPRTLRRERELRERTLRDQGRSGLGEAGSWRDEPRAAAPGGYDLSRPEPGNTYDRPRAVPADELTDVAVRRIKVPFFSLMGFFIKAVFAAVPALLILFAMLYGLGMVLEAYFPWIIKMKILVSFPQ
jgi:hypothetical protein